MLTPLNFFEAIPTVCRHLGRGFVYFLQIRFFVGNFGEDVGTREHDTRRFEPAEGGGDEEENVL